MLCFCFNMENLFYYFALLLSAFLIFKQYFHRNRRLPPSPLALPIIGHLHLIKKSLHEALNDLSSQYGPIFSIRFGSRSIVVVSSPSAVEECFTRNDIIFSSRPRFMAVDRFTYDYRVFVWTPYGHLWRDLRRLTTIELFSSNSLHKSAFIREEEIHSVLRQLFKVSSSGSQKVELKFYFYSLTFNLMMRMVAGKQCVTEEDIGVEAGKQIIEELKGTFFTTVSMNMCDFFPILRWIGYKGLEKSMIALQKKRDVFLQGLIDEFRQKKTSPSNANTVIHGKKTKTLIETLFSLQESEPEFYTEDLIKSLILVMFVGGTETSATAMEWVMSLLLTHPKVLDKARAEIDNHVGRRRLLNDSDLAQLPYLRCIINEALRLYPPVPLLVPRIASEDCTLGGFEIPQGTILVVNAWAMQRDPKVWEEPSEFKPERFQAIEGEREGFKSVPFGMGRRSCPGNTMALRIVMLAVGALIQCFDWEKVEPAKMDMSQNASVTLRKAKALEAVCVPRTNSFQLVSQL